MAKTYRYIALSLLLLTWSHGQAKETEMTAIDLVSTSGTMVMRHVEAASLTISPDIRQLITEKLHMVVRMDEENQLDATAAKGIVNINGDKEYAEQLLKDKTQREVLKLYGDNFNEICYPKDFLFGHNNTNTTITLGNNGTIKTEKLIWSELLQWHLIPGKFDQSMTLEDGSLITVTGMGAVIIIDEKSKNWSYYGDENQQVEMIFTNPAPAQ